MPSTIDDAKEQPWLSAGGDTKPNGLLFGEESELSLFLGIRALSTNYYTVYYSYGFPNPPTSTNRIKL